MRPLPMALRITLWNVKGLRSLTKKTKVLRHLKKLHTDIALLQETPLGTQDYFRLKKFWVGEVVGSPAKDKKAGVLILMKKNLPYCIQNIDRDEEGRRISITLTNRSKHREPFTISNIYAPNSLSKEYFQSLTQWFLLKTTSKHHIVGGDFNSTISDAEDRQLAAHTKIKRLKQGKKTKTQSYLQDFVTHTRLTDLWRTQNLIGRVFTFYSPAHTTFSRIDYLFATPHLSNKKWRSKK